MSERRSTGCGTWLFLFVLMFFGVAYLVMKTTDRPEAPKRRPAARPASKQPVSKAPASSKRPADFDASPEMQAERKAFIEKGIGNGLWEKTEFTGSLPKLWVTKKFLYLADEKEQNTFLSPVYAYWMGELDTFGGRDFFWDALVLKFDNGTPLGRRVGTYTPIDGFKPK